MKITTLLHHIKQHGKKDEQPNGRGNTVTRLFMPDERYTVDFADDFRESGLEQFDTSQDAEYFGVWINRPNRYTLTYAEGDWTLVECPDFEHYKAEVEDCIRFYQPGRIATVIGNGLDGSGSVHVIEQDRSKFVADEPAPQIGLADVLNDVLSN